MGNFQAGSVKLFIFAEESMFRILRPHLEHRQIVVLDVFLDNRKFFIGKRPAFLDNRITIRLDDKFRRARFCQFRIARVCVDTFDDTRHREIEIVARDFEREILRHQSLPIKSLFFK